MNTELTSPIDAFATLAREFCMWCEAESLGPHPHRTAASWLALLYAGALKLPEVEPETEDAMPDPPLEDRARAKRNFAQFCGQVYRQVFDPRPENDDAPLFGDLGDDLTDIYDDIKGSLILYERGNTIDAAWQWRFTHEIHWGHHAVGALFGIHHLSVSGLT